MRTVGWRGRVLRNRRWRRSGPISIAIMMLTIVLLALEKVIATSLRSRVEHHFLKARIVEPRWCVIVIIAASIVILLVHMPTMFATDCASVSRIITGGTAIVNWARSWSRSWGRLSTANLIDFTFSVLEEVIAACF